MASDPYTTEPSEAELREMLEAREREKELQRKQLSRRFSVIVVVAILLIAAAIYLMPDREVKPGASAKAAMTTLLSNKAPAVPDELKPFSIKPEKNAEKDNIRFASELLKFMQPGDPVANPSSTPAKP